VITLNLITQLKAKIMRKMLIKTSMAIAVVMLFTACKKNAADSTGGTISQTTLDKIYQLGFSNKNVIAHDGKYIVEGDILLSEEDLNTAPETKLLRVGEEEQYRTTRLVTGLPRTIRVAISSSLSSAYVTALDNALARYNALGLRITFTRVSSSPNITLVRGSGNFLASAGFPTSSGNPYSQVIVNPNAIGNQPTNTIATIIAHELGHCIGFRHTDYMNRAYSCGGSPVNEGASSVGAILVPGTPSGPDPNSWMLSCIGSGQNRPFNANDRTALNYLY
jgi:hypothetical protein